MVPVVVVLLLRTVNYAVEERKQNVLLRFRRSLEGTSLVEKANPAAAAADDEEEGVADVDAGTLCHQVHHPGRCSVCAIACAGRWWTPGTTWVARRSETSAVHFDPYAADKLRGGAADVPDAADGGTVDDTRDRTVGNYHHASAVDGKPGLQDPPVVSTVPPVDADSNACPEDTVVDVGDAAVAADAVGGDSWSL